MKRTICLIGVSLMMCFGQRDQLPALAIPDWIVEVGLPIQLSPEPLLFSRYRDKAFHWLHEGRFLAYALAAKDESNAVLWVFNPQTRRSTRLAECPDGSFVFADRAIYYVDQQARDGEWVTTLIQYNPLTGRARPLLVKRKPVDETDDQPLAVCLDVSPKERLTLLRVDGEAFVVDIATGQEIPLPSRETFEAACFLVDDTTLFGYVRQGSRLLHAHLHIPSGAIIQRPEPLFPAMEPPKPSTNFEFQIANEALYLVAVSNPSSELREVFLTRDFRTYEPATLIFTGEDTAKPVPYAKVAPNENGLALVSVHDQLYYVPLTKREPRTMEEALACGKEITNEMLLLD
ncbi:MAG: hypothetical protein SNJ72_03650, partial [Fimbriimonadales bacterium]